MLADPCQTAIKIGQRNDIGRVLCCVADALTTALFFFGHPLRMRLRSYRTDGRDALAAAA